MSEQPRPQRVRVTGPPRNVAARPRSRLGDVRDQTPLGDLYLRSLLREQARLAAGVLLLLAVLLGGVPLLFHLAPGLADADVAGLPLTWLVLGAGVYPFLVLVGWRFVRRAERNERVFADLLVGDEADRGDRAEP